MTLHVVALSGGKDSSAMALRLAETEPRDYTYVCTPTGDELSEMYAHWRKLAELLGKPLTPIIGGTLRGLIQEQGALPNWRQRWCTRMLKIEPYAAWLMRQQETHAEIVSYVGLRADEEHREGGDYTSVPSVVSRFPMREWGWRLKDVLAYLEQRQVTIPKRTDCARCFYHDSENGMTCGRNTPMFLPAPRWTEVLVGHTYRSPQRDTWPAALVDLRAEFEKGRVPRGASKGDDELKGMQCRVCRI